MELDNTNCSVVGPEENESLRCNDCGDVFETIEILRAHRDSVHLRVTKRRVKVLRKCDYCDECFDFNDEKLKHIRERHPDKLDGIIRCTVCNKTYATRETYKGHMNAVHSGKQVQKLPCKICGKLLSEYSLKTHIRTVHSTATINSIPCPLCPYMFRRRDLVADHMRKRHKVTMAAYKKSLASSDTTSTSPKE